MTISRVTPEPPPAFFDDHDLILHSAPVRALAWSCFAAPLLGSVETLASLSLSPARRAWLLALDRDDSALRSYLATHCASRRLGLVYESLWHFFLEQDPACQLIAHNIPVRSDSGRSLGEFDVLYRDVETHSVVHLELAVKFFLAQPHPEPGQPLSRWLGPNSADRLDIKLERLLNHQLPLAQTPEGLQSLRGLGVDHFLSRFRIGGMLFFRHGEEPANDPSTDPLDPHYLRGDWLSSEEEFDLDRWRLLAKPDWLSARYEDARPVTRFELQDLVARRPVMLINEHGARRFVVHHRWPENIFKRSDT